MSGAKFTGGEFEDGRLMLVRQDLSTAQLPGLLLCLGTLTDNSDGSYELTFGGS